MIMMIMMKILMKMKNNDSIFNAFFIFSGLLVLILFLTVACTISRPPEYIEDAMRCKGIAYNICGSDSLDLGCGKTAERECMVLLGYSLKKGRLVKSNRCDAQPK